MKRCLFSLLMIGAGVALVFLKPDWIIRGTEVPFGWLLGGFGVLSLLWNLHRVRSERKKKKK